MLPDSDAQCSEGEGEGLRRPTHLRGRQHSPPGHPALVADPFCCKARIAPDGLLLENGADLSHTPCHPRCGQLRGGQLFRVNSRLWRQWGVQGKEGTGAQGDGLAAGRWLVSLVSRFSFYVVLLAPFSVAWFYLCRSPHATTHTPAVRPRRKG